MVIIVGFADLSEWERNYVIPDKTVTICVIFILKIEMVLILLDFIFK